VSGKVFDLVAPKERQANHNWQPQKLAWREPQADRAVTLAEILEPEPTPHIPDYVGRRLAGKYRDRPIVSDPARGDIAPTCVAHYAKDLSRGWLRTGGFRTACGHTRFENTLGCKECLTHSLSREAAMMLFE
jgi:hypothetical protein